MEEKLDSLLEVADLQKPRNTEIWLAETPE